MWRLIVDGPVDAARNMARDRAVQLAREEGVAPPTLRLYRWTRPTLTLGRFQDAREVDLSVAAGEGVDVVRRATGGRAVLHEHEVTYCVVASTDDGIPRGVAASYRMLCSAIVASLAGLGVQAQLVERDTAAAPSAACYLATTRADVAANGLKLSGSAQVWHGATVMQHGSFVIERDVGRERRLLGLSPAEAARLACSAGSIAEITGRTPGVEEVTAAVVAGFEGALGVRFDPGTLTPREVELEEELLAAGTDVPMRGLSTG